MTRDECKFPCEVLHGNRRIGFRAFPTVPENFEELSVTDPWIGNPQCFGDDQF